MEMGKNIKEKSTSGIQIVRGFSGLTIIQLIIALIILMVLVLIATKIYTSYIRMAQVTVARGVLDDAGRSLFDYMLGNGRYPDSIDFTGCTDEQGQSVFPSSLCKQMREELYSIEGYSTSSTGFVLTARAKDSKHTLLTLRENKFTTEGK